MFQPEERDSAYRDSFRLFDKDGNGTISPEELSEFMRSIGETPTDAELETIMKGVDANNDGNIDFEEFLSLMSHRPKPSGAGKDEDELRHVFEVFDRDGNGTINFEELKTVMKDLGERLSDEECKLMMEEADTNGDGVISFHEFCRVSCYPRYPRCSEKGDFDD